MYSIILKDGKIINIKGDDVVFYEKTKIVRFYYKNVRMVAEINMDNVVGWVRTVCIKNEE
jgi:uncharacterized protein (UPF0333 family)